jgi:hypothetical protein
VARKRYGAAVKGATVTLPIPEEEVIAPLLPMTMADTARELHSGLRCRSRATGFKRHISAKFRWTWEPSHLNVALKSKRREVVTEATARG